MPTWRCPHCGAAQPETARCWVCKRSSTSCSTCRNYRRSIAGQLGYCGLDRKRSPLSGDEIRGCWLSLPPNARPADSAPWASRVIDPATGGRRSRVDFVPIGELGASVARVGDAGPRRIERGPTPSVEAVGTYRFMLWDDAEA